MKAVLLLLLGYITVTAHSQEYAYDCRRLDDCQNGGTCVVKGADEAIGSCACAPGFSGWNCMMPSSPVPCTDATVCKNGAACYKDGTSGADVCSCANGYYGATCEQQLVKINCLGQQITFDLNFPVQFDGNVKLDLAPGDTSVPPDSCTFKSSEANGIRTRSLAININVASTPEACGKEYISGNETTSTAKFRVHYLKTIETSVDQVFLLTCSHVEGEIVISKEISNVNLNTMGNLTVVEKEVSYSPVDYELLDGKDAPLVANTELYVGDTFQIFVYLTETDVYKNIMITSCVTNNTLADANSKVFEIMKLGCPTTNAKRSTDEQRSLDKDKAGVKTPGKAISIKAFKFTDSSKIGIVCKIKVCKEGDATCAPPTDCEAVRKTAATGGTGTDTGTGTETGGNGTDTGTGGTGTGGNGTDTGTGGNGTDTGTGGNGTDTGTGGTGTGGNGTDTGTGGTGTSGNGTDTGTAGNGTDTGTGGNGTDTGTGGTGTGGNGTDTGTGGTGETGTGGTGETGTGGTGTGGTGTGGTGTGGTGETGTGGTGTGGNGTDTGTGGTGETGTGGTGETGTGGTGTEGTGTEGTGTGGTGETGTGGTGTGDAGTGGTATNAAGAERRRKRAADDEEIETVSTVLRVRGGRDDVLFDGQTGTSAGKNIDNCMEQTSIIAVVAVLAGVVAILFMICFILAFLVIRRRNQKNVFEPAHSYKSDRFHIPRVHVNEAYMGIPE